MNILKIPYIVGGFEGSQSLWKQEGAAAPLAPPLNPSMITKNLEWRENKDKMYR